MEHNGVKPEYCERVSIILSHIKDSDVIYRVASQLGLKRILETTCLDSSSTPYLKDTIFVKGCTSDS